MQSRTSGAFNPFRDGIVGDAWDATAPNDVASIHRKVFEACLHAVNQVRDLGIPGGMIVYGMAGSGKTHLVRRLREELTTHFRTPNLSELRQIFAYVRLDTSAQAIARHVRNRVATDLLRKSQVSGVSQFEWMVVARLMALLDGDGDMLYYWEYLRSKSSAEIEDSLLNLGETCGLSSTFVRVLVHLVKREHRLDVAAWLRGESLSEDGYRRLGIGMPDNDDPETEALHVLRDFVSLGGAKLPLILCFDQVEALQTSANDLHSLFAYGQLIRNLSNANRNVLLLSCMQTSLFDLIKASLSDYQLAALLSLPAKSLDPLKHDEAALLLKARLRGMASLPDWPRENGDLWPITDADIASWVGPHGTTPRHLLFEAAATLDERLNQIVEPQPKQDVTQWLHKRWDEALDAALNSRKAEDTVEVLRNSLPDLVQLTDPTWKLADTRIPHIDFILEGPQQEAKVGVALLDNSSAKLPHQLKSLCQQIEQRKDLHKLILIRDERLPFSSNATATRDRLKKLTDGDAVLHWIAPEAVAALAAARSLLASVKAGDLSFEGQTVAIKTVSDWLALNMPASLQSTAEVLTLPAAGRDLMHDRVEQLQGILQNNALYLWIKRRLP